MSVLDTRVILDTDHGPMSAVMLAPGSEDCPITQRVIYAHPEVNGDIEYIWED